MRQERRKQAWKSHRHTESGGVLAWAAPSKQHCFPTWGISLATATPALGMPLYLPELSCEKVPLFCWFIFLLKVTWWIYWILYFMCLNWQPWGISFWSLCPCFPSHCHSREWIKSVNSSRCKKTKKNPFKNNYSGSYLVFWGGIIVGNFIWLLDSPYLRYLCGFHYHGIRETCAHQCAHPMAPVHRAAALLAGFAPKPSESLQLLLWFYLESKAQVPHMFLTSGKLAALQFSWALLPFPSPCQHNF